MPFSSVLPNTSTILLTLLFSSLSPASFSSPQTLTLLSSQPHYPIQILPIRPKRTFTSSALSQRSRGLRQIGIQLGDSILVVSPADIHALSSRLEQ